MLCGAIRVRNYAQTCSLSERCLAMQNIDHVFVSAGIPYSYGFAIIALTLAVKVATFPLTKKQARLGAAAMSVCSLIAGAVFANAHAICETTRSPQR